MSPTVESPSRVLFGLFEADLQTGELWKAGKRIKIQSQPFKVLTALLEHPGEIVTREDLQLRVWGKDTIVDFDHSLGTAINKIREALSDSADNPRFVETLARRGYRFIAPVSYPAGSAPSQPALLAAPDDLSPEHQNLASLAASSEHVPPRTRTPIRWTLIALAVLAAAGLGFYTGGQRSSVKSFRVNQITHTGRISPGARAMESLPATATDGVRIFASVIENGRANLSQISISDGDAQPLAVPSEIAAPSLGDLSPDGSKLLLRSHLSPESEQALWIVPTDGGSALRVANILAHDATWMPDGKNILYASGNQLFLTRANGGTPTNYSTLPGRAFWLRWSPDKKRLRFTVIDPVTHTFSLWELPAGSNQPHQILANWTQPATECCGTWTADGKYYVFQSSHDGTTDLWRLNGNDTSNPQKLTNGPLSYQAPVAGRTGHRIFFLGVDTHSELQRYIADRKEFVPERTFLADASRVVYSRDRKWVAWTDPQGHLWRARSDGPTPAGTEKLQLTSDTFEVFLAQWSPDGTHLALMGHEPGKAWQIYLTSADGGIPEHLLPENHNQADPSWSPDGNRLVFGRVPDLMGKEAGERNLQILDLHTRKLETVPGSDGLFSPRWSPDGRYIVALTLDQRSLRLFDTATKTWKLLADTSVADPVWSADSKAIYIHAFMADTQPIYRVSVPDGHLDPIASLADFRNGDTADYFFTGITPDNTPLVRTRSSTGNLYSIDLDGN